MIKRLSLFLLIFATAHAATPQRVVSMSLCTDQLLLWLADPEQIAAVSYLATDPLYSHHVSKAKQFKTHHADVEMIMSLKPDLVLASRYERSQATNILQRFGINVLMVDSPYQLKQIADYVNMVANALGQQKKAQSALLKIENILKSASLSPTDSSPLAVSLSASGYQQGISSMHNQLLHLAGIRSVADVMQWEFDGNLSLEKLIELQPTVFLVSDGKQGVSLAERWAVHPAMSALQAKRKYIELKTADWICAGPWSIDAAMQLRQELKR